MNEALSSFQKKRRREWGRPILVSLITACVCIAAMSFGLLETWSLRISDRLYLPHQADPRIVIVAIDDAAIGRIGRWPWDRSAHAAIIRRISDAKPLAIGYDVNFPEPSKTSQDTKLADAIRAAENVILPVELELAFDDSSQIFTAKRTLPPISEIASAAKNTGHTNTPQDVDGVVRQVPLSVELPDQTLIDAFAYQIAEAGGADPTPGEGTDYADRLIVNYPDRPKMAFPIISAREIANSTEPLSVFKNKFVLVGATASDLHDEQRVPTSFNQPMSGVELHASILNTILQKNYLHYFPKPLLAAWLLIVAVLLGLIISAFRARWSVPLALLFWIFSAVGSFMLFDQGWIVDILWPTITIIAVFSVVMLERRIRSEQQKREIRSAFSHYVSESVVESILDDPAKLRLGGERKDMTVMFSDIRGFTTISEGLSPEQLVEIMNTYLSRMTDIVFKHEGVLDKYIGDAVMAFWNAPFDQADHAKRAVETALDMLETLVQMNAQKVFGDIELKIGIGINTGEMVVGNMGSKKRFDYTVIGDNVNLGSRMEGLTKQYHISLLISESTKNALPEGEYLIRQVDLVAVKGKKEPIKMYEILKRKADATGDDEEFLILFNRAITAYFNKDFANAAALTQELLAMRSMDGPTQVLHERAEKFKQEPPGDDWNGVWVMTTK